MNFADRISFQFATGFGLGYLPGPTGTYGSLLGLLLYWLAIPYLSDSWKTVLAAIFFFLAVISSTRAAGRFQRQDPGQVVCDEICGQWISLLYLPGSWRTLLAGFLLFRFFDIVKPFPARRLEHLPGGWGIVADDVMAGLYANISLHLLLYFKAIPWLYS